MLGSGWTPKVDGGTVEGRKTETNCAGLRRAAIIAPRAERGSKYRVQRM